MSPVFNVNHAKTFAKKQEEHVSSAFLLLQCLNIRRKPEFGEDYERKNIIIHAFVGTDIHDDRLQQ